MPQTDIVKVYYARGASFVDLLNNTFLRVPDNGQKPEIVTELPPNHSESSPTADNQGNTGGHARSLIDAACKVVHSMAGAHASIST